MNTRVRLTAAQSRLLKSIREEALAHPDESPWMEVSEQEVPSAFALARKGLLIVHEDGRDVRLP